MAQEINLGGTIYISSKKAAEITGYAQDYIGQLARAGNIIAQRVSGLWYVVEESLRSYKAKADEFKPTPPPLPPPTVDLETTVSFDGKDYVSAQRAAKITGYHQDYVGQLARSGKILSRQIGARWYVDREGIVEHKKYNDALLAAVQTESVGLQKPEILPVEPVREESELHFTYKEEVVTPIPVNEELIRPEIDSIENHDISAVDTEYTNEEEAYEIPIRIVERRTTYTPVQQGSFKRDTSSWRKFAPIGAILGLTLVLIGGFVLITTASPAGSVASIGRVFGKNTVLSGFQVPEWLQSFVSKELLYKRNGA